MVMGRHLREESAAPIPEFIRLPDGRQFRTADLSGNISNKTTLKRTKHGFSRVGKPSNGPSKKEMFDRLLRDKDLTAEELMLIYTDRNRQQCQALMHYARRVYRELPELRDYEETGFLSD